MWAWWCSGADNMVGMIIVVVVVVCVKGKCGMNGDVGGSMDMVEMTVNDDYAGAICGDSEACADRRLTFLAYFLPNDGDYNTSSNNTNKSIKNNGNILSRTVNAILRPHLPPRTAATVPVYRVLLSRAYYDEVAFPLCPAKDQHFTCVVVVAV